MVLAALPELNQRLRLHHGLLIRKRVERMDEQTLRVTFKHQKAERGIGLAAFGGDANDHAPLLGIGFDLVMSTAEVGPFEHFALEAGVVVVAGLIAPGRHFAVDRPEAGENAVLEQSLGGQNDVCFGQHFGKEAALRVPDNDVTGGCQLRGDIVPQFLHALPGPDSEELRVERPSVGLKDQIFD